MEKISERIDGDECWICGIKFVKEDKDKRKTFHHSIEKRYNPQINLKVPICQKCHHLINKEDLIYKRAYNSLKGFFLLADKIITKKLEKLK